MRTTRARLALTTVALLFATVAPVRAGELIPTTTEMALEAPDPQVQQEVCVDVTSTVTADGTSFFGGTLTVYDTTTGSDVFFFDASYSHGSLTGWCTSSYSVGAYSYRADYSGNATYAPSSATLEFEVSKLTPDFFLSTIPESPDSGSPFEITAGLHNSLGEEGSLEIHMVGQDDPICSGPVPESSITCTPTAPSSPGTYQFTVSYSGSASVEAATSDPFEVVVQENSVHASNVAVQYSTFYPVKDGYRDTVAIMGTRNETIGVTIKIYSPSGSLLTTKTIASGTGGYSYTWNGRRPDGTIRPAGKYKITQKLKDEGGASKTSTFFVTLSKKQLTWHSDTITKSGSSFSAIGKEGRGSVSTSGGTVRLKTPNGFTGDWSAVGYQFTMKSGLGYKNMKVAVYAQRGFVGGPETVLGAQDFNDCSIAAPWNESCFDHWKDIGNPSNTAAWYTTRELAARNRSGTKVRSMVSNGSGITYIYKVRVTYKYATLE